MMFGNFLPLVKPNTISDGPKKRLLIRQFYDCIPVTLSCIFPGCYAISNHDPVPAGDPVFGVHDSLRFHGTRRPQPDRPSLPAHRLAAGDGSS